MTNDWTATLGPRLNPKASHPELVTARIEWKTLGGNPGPYFAITGTAYGRDRVRGERAIKHGGASWWPQSVGCLHETIHDTFPELAPFLRWHLCDARGPMHYRANGLYFAEQICGVEKHMRREYDPDPAKAFRTTVAFGALPGDAMPEVPTFGPEVGPDERRAVVREIFGAWLDRREAALREAFAADLRRVYDLTHPA